MRSAIIALLTALPLLQGCGALIAGGAAATGVVLSQDRRTVGTLTEDEASRSGPLTASAKNSRTACMST